ncbi:MAG: hypothetical protein WKG07_28690 [Hymenobacter sp.]
MTKRYPLLLTLPLLLAGPAAWAQQPAPGRVSGDFRGLPFADFVRQVEAQTTYRFFYDPAATDTVVVRAQANGLPLPALLTQVLGRAQPAFALDEASRRVYVTAGAPLQVRIPDDAFQPGAPLAVLPPVPTPFAQPVAALVAARWPALPNLSFTRWGLRRGGRHR